MTDEEGVRKVKSEGKVRRLAKKDTIIRIKLQNPKAKAEEIAQIMGTSKAYVWKVWSQYCRKSVKLRESPYLPTLPFFVKVYGFWTDVPTSWYDACPVKPSDNRNLQKIHSTPWFSFIIHKGGRVFVYPYFQELDQWRKPLEDWLRTWLDEAGTWLLINNLNRSPRKDIAFQTPGVEKGYTVRLKGIGTFKTDKTPWPEGTSEFEFDPGYDRRLGKVEGDLSDVKGVLRIIAENMQAFGEGMKQHLALIQELRKESQERAEETLKVIQSLQETTTVLKEALKPPPAPLPPRKRTLKEIIEEWWETGYY